MDDPHRTEFSRQRSRTGVNIRPRDFCYYANCIFVITILLFPSNKKLFMVCFSFAEGPLAWAIIVWRCSLVFSSFDKILSVLIHLLPGDYYRGLFR